MKDTILYDRLGLKPGCSEGEMKKAYFKMSKKWHPDKNKSEEATKKFQEIAEAYDILSNSEKREMYHQVGIDILKNGAEGGGGMDPSEMFRNFFGGGMGGFDFNFGGSGRQRDEKEDIHHKMHVSLEDIFNGKTIKINYKKQVYCKDCDGTGSKDKKKHTCDDCGGSGQKVKVMQMGPMIQKAVQPCGKCSGTGKSSNSADKCLKCNGMNHTVVSESINIPIRKGIREGMKIQVDGKGNEYKEGTTKLILHVVEKSHSTFQRQDDDIIMEMNINLAESIIGFEREILFLDGQKIVVDFKKGKSIGDGDVKMIKGKGMPSMQGNTGNLMIKFNVTPINLESLRDTDKQLLSRILKHEPKKVENKAKYNLEEYNMRQHHQNGGPNVRMHMGGMGDDGPGQCTHQ